MSTMRYIFPHAAWVDSQATATGCILVTWLLTIFQGLVVLLIIGIGSRTAIDRVGLIAAIVAAGIGFGLSCLLASGLADPASRRGTRTAFPPRHAAVGYLSKWRLLASGLLVMIGIGDILTQGSYGHGASLAHLSFQLTIRGSLGVVLIFLTISVLLPANNVLRVRQTK